MKKTILIFIVGIMISNIGISQDFTLTNQSKLFYKFTEYDKTVTYSFSILATSPAISYEWSNSNKEENNGNGIITAEAMAGAINLAFFYTDIELVTMYDRTPSFIVSKKIYDELKISEKSRIRIQDNENTNTLTVVGTEEFELTINKEVKKVNAIHATFNGASGNEIWILDNPDFPIILKLKSIKEYELKEVKTN